MPRDRAYLVVIQRPSQHRSFEDQYEEIRELTESAGGAVVGSSKVNLTHPSASHFIRHGKLEEVRDQAGRAGANVLIFNSDLTPVQSRNIESGTGIRAVDRTGLILDIFARRAQSREGKMQVELAQLKYLLPRLVGRGVIMSRLGGGIGTRGPGEQKLEVDRRKIRERIQRIKGELKKLEKHRQLLREGRKSKKFMQVALVGYTNAGKTTLLNALTGAGSRTEDKMFATLDPKTRILNLNSRNNIVFTDTVGFLRDLPHDLVEAFHATLEEVVMADLILHVLDISARNAGELKRVVEEVLEEIGAREKLILLALNKSDLILPADRDFVLREYPEGALISAKQKLGLNELLLSIERSLNKS